MSRIDNVDVRLAQATSEDAGAVAMLHAQSWRDAYRGLVPDEFLDGAVFENRLTLWRKRFAEADDRQIVLTAVSDGSLVGFSCVLADAEPIYGPLLDNLHVLSEWRGRGIGRRLLGASRAWSQSVARGQPMHLWVIEENLDARHFYSALGGIEGERKTTELVPGIVVTAIRYVWKPVEGPSVWCCADSRDSALPLKLREGEPWR